jgi:hypothetical protein
MRRALLALACVSALFAVGCSSGEVSEGGALEKQKEINDATEAGMQKEGEAAKSDRE